MSCRLSSRIRSRMGLWRLFPATNLLRPTLNCSAASYLILPGPTLSYPILPHITLHPTSSYLVLPYPTPSYPILPWIQLHPTRSYLILPHTTPSYPVLQLFLLAASNNFTVIIRHVPGVQNCIADSLSRFQMDRFRSLTPDALPLPVTTPAIPTFTSELDWGHFSRQELHPPRGGHTYAAGIQEYQRFCSTYNLSPLPASATTLQFFCAYSSDSRAYSTIKVYLAAIRLFHIENHHPDPTAATPLLHYTLQAIRREQAHTSGIRLPILQPHLHCLKTGLWSSSMPAQDRHAYWAAFTLAFSGCLRASEYCAPSPTSFDPERHLVPSDIALSANAITLYLKHSKTNQFGPPQVVHIVATHSPTCPVVAMSRFLRHGQASQVSPLFTLSSGRYLTRSDVSATMKSLLCIGGYKSRHYSSHNFRIGAATAAALAGMPDHAIQLLGRWKSDTFRRYVRPPQPPVTSGSSTAHPQQERWTAISPTLVCHICTSIIMYSRLYLFHIVPSPIFDLHLLICVPHIAPLWSTLTHLCASHCSPLIYTYSFVCLTLLPFDLHLLICVPHIAPLWSTLTHLCTSHCSPLIYTHSCVLCLLSAFTNF